MILFSISFLLLFNAQSRMFSSLFNLHIAKLSFNNFNDNIAFYIEKSHLMFINLVLKTLIYFLYTNS